MPETQLNEARCPRCGRPFYLEPDEGPGALCCICRRDECLEELAQWFTDHRRHMTRRDMRPIVARYFAGDREATEFLEYLHSTEGRDAFRKRLQEKLDTG